MNKYNLALAISAWFSVASFGSDPDGLQDDEAWLDELFGADPLEEALLAEEPEESIEEARELLAAMKALTAWTSEYGLASGLGWKENVLLESGGGVDSAYAQVEADYFAMRPGLKSKPELIAVLYGEYRYFDDVPGLDDESLLVAQLSAGRSIGERWKASVMFEGVRTEQAFDESIVESESSASTVTLWQPRLEARVERDLNERSALELAAYVSDASYDLGSEDYWEHGFDASYAYRLPDGSSLNFEVGVFAEDYDERLSRLSTGSLEDPTLLELEGSRWSGEWLRSMDSGLLRRWRTRVEYEQEDDREGDYFERESWQARQSVELVWGNWEMALAASYGKLDYAKRKSGIEVDAVPRSDAFWRWSAELRRPFAERFFAFARLEDSEKDSNAEELSYASSGAFLGLSFSR